MGKLHYFWQQPSKAGTLPAAEEVVDLLLLGSDENAKKNNGQTTAADIIVRPINKC